MDDLKFEWDPEKNEINKKKHQISFEEARESESVIRIISARKATRLESRQYFN